MKLISLCIALCLGFKTPAAAPSLNQTDLFISGEGNYHTCRIPALVVATNGAVLAFCEGRKSGAGDSDNIDLILKRSLDSGQTFQPIQLIRAGAGSVCGNPAPVVDRTTGEIFLLSTWNRGSDTEKKILGGTSADTRRVFVQSSKDNGATWSASREITADLKKPHWRWYATGPGNGIQLTRGPRAGRLLVPANHSDHSDPARHPYRSHVIYSDDHGASWRLGGVEEEKTNESTLVELSNGDILQNMRSYHGKNCRAIATSHDGGLTFSPVTLATNLIDSVCQASLLRLRDGKILFANPASTKRENMTIRLSSDDAKTWPISKTLHSGPSAYSCLAELPDGTILCVYERGEKSPYEKITLARFSEASLVEK
jgi:sialidase-1